MRPSAIFCLLFALPAVCCASVSVGVATVTADSGARGGFLPLSVSGSGFASFEITLSYDNTVIEVVPGWYHPGTGEVSADALTPLSEPFVIRLQRVVSGKTTTLKIAGSSQKEAPAATGLFLRVKVNVTGAPGEQSPVRCSAKFFDLRGVEIPATATDGAVLVTRWPRIACAPASIETVCRSGNNPPDETFEVWNIGGKISNFRIVSTVPWLTCTPAAGSSDGRRVPVTIQFRTINLVPGTYEGTILISDANADNNPQEITVTVTVYPRIARTRPL